MKLFKKITVSILTIALLIGIIPSAVFAGENQKDYNGSGWFVNSIKVTTQDGGTVRKTDTDKPLTDPFPCGNGNWGWSTWEFEAKADTGYEFDGWDTIVTWQQYVVVGKFWGFDIYDWVNKSSTNPGNIYHNHKAGQAFTINNNAIKVNHVICSANPTIKNVNYSATAKFKKAPLTLTINHKTKVVDQYGAELRTDTVTTVEDTTNLFVGNLVKPSQYQNDANGTFDTTQDAEITLVKGENIIDVHYTKEESTQSPATITVNHIGIVYDQFGTEVRRKNFESDELTDYKSDDVVTPADLQKDVNKNFKFDNTQNESVTLVAGENIVNVYYTRVIYVNQPTTITVKHIGVEIDQFGSEKLTDLKPEKIIEGYKEKQTVNSSDFAVDGGIDGFNFASDRNQTLKLKLDATKNVLNVYYTKGVYIDQKVDVKVNHIAITQNSSGTEVSRKTLREDIIEDEYYEKMIIKSELFKDDELTDEFDYDTSLDETVTLVYLGGDANYEGQNTINVYYVKKLAPPVIIIPTNPVIPPVVEEVEDNDTPLSSGSESINDDETPLSSGAESIGDEKTPLGTPTKSPQTGDNNSSAILLALAAAAGIGLLTRKSFKKASKNN